jgi:hypothetical protein
MKRLTVLLLSLVLLTSMSVAQVIALEDIPVFAISGSSYVKLTATIAGPTAYTRDSTIAANAFPIIYNGTAHPTLLGQYPDSMAVFSYGTADTAHDVLIRFKGASRYGQTVSSFTSVLVDSNLSTSAAVSMRRTTISATLYALYDVYGISCQTQLPTDAYNALDAAHRSKIYVRVVRYFHR